MRVTTERAIDEASTELFLNLYRSAFAPLETLAAGRQSLTDDEFREEMAEDSVLKFVGWNRHDEPVALAVVATDLSVVPWISPAFWAERYPDHAERDAIWYFGALLVSPTVKGGPWMRRLTIAAMTECARNRVVAAFDCCRYNDTEVKLPQLLADVGHSFVNLRTELVDLQVYYGYEFDGFLEGQTIADPG
jgi:hypothetical protein